MRELGGPQRALFLVATLVLGCLEARVAAGETRLLFEGPSPEAYSLARASLLSDPPPQGSLRIVGRYWNEDRVPLFEARAPLGKRVEAVFFVASDLRSLLLQGELEGGGWEELEEVPLAAENPERARARRSEVPPLPLHPPRSARPPPRFVPSTGEPFLLAREAMTLLFVSPEPRASALVLLVLALLSALPLGGLIKVRDPRFARLGSLLVVLASSSLALLLALSFLPSGSELMSLDLPARSERSAGLTLTLSETKSGGFALRHWGRPEGLRLFVLRTGPDRGLPLELLADNADLDGTLFDFDPPPLISNRGGQLFVFFPGLGRGWRVTHE